MDNNNNNFANEKNYLYYVKYIPQRQTPSLEHLLFRPPHQSTTIVYTKKKRQLHLAYSPIRNV